MTKKQIAVISGVVIVFVLLFFANKKLPIKREEIAETNSSQFETYLSKAKTVFNEKQKAAFQKLETNMKNAESKASAYAQLLVMFDSLRQPVAAAIYCQRMATELPSAVNWNNAANRFYNATRFVPETERSIFFKEAIILYEKVVALDSGNTEAKISLASCYVEGSAEPMKGIGMLREIEKTDSNNVNLQMNFAFFSEKSGQWDKAIARFEKVLRIKPDFIEAYLHLADAYVQKGDKTKAIVALEKYNTLIDDNTIKTEINNYINKLKTN
jgi:tetratricopeptide (TPR) repeat protein